MFVTRCLYLIGDDSHEDYWNKGHGNFVLVLSIPIKIALLSFKLPIYE